MAHSGLPAFGRAALRAVIQHHNFTQEPIPTMSKICTVKAREILDSRGNPTVEVDVKL